MNIKIWLLIAQLMLVHSNAPNRDAEILLEFVMKKKVNWLKAFNTSITNKYLKKLNYFLNKRVQGNPIAYLIREWEFWSLSLRITPRIFIPRADTETLVDQALFYINKPGMKILDLGSGSGAIALAIAHERSNCSILGVDYNPNCVLLAQFNARKLQIKNVSFIYSNWFTKLSKKKFHVIVSNPPYIDRTDIHLKYGDLRFENIISLISKNKGLFDLKIIISQSKNYLADKGWLLVEHGWKQGKYVRQFMMINHFSYVRTYLDLTNNERVTCGQNYNINNIHRTN
ncbi:MAG: peptide chain release factor N(5)-glutamine methyltransferase [Candidatus Dasytiphilus stammeri]